MLKGKSPYQGMTMRHIVAKRLAPPTPGGINETTVPQSANESSRNNTIQGFWNAMNYKGFVLTRVELPGDVSPHAKGDTRQEQIRKAQAGRQAEWNRQASMPWGNQRMATPTDAQRLNNPSQSSFVKQRQLAPPNTYGQFYAFMHALSAAFGNLNQ